MSKKTGLYIRVGQEWMERLRVEAGASGEVVSEYVRKAVEFRMAGYSNDVVAGTSDVVEPTTSKPSNDPEPAWRKKLYEQQEELERKKAQDAQKQPQEAPAQIKAGFVAMRERTPQERAAAQERLNALGGMKLMPQMVKPKDPYALGDPEPSED